MKKAYSLDYSIERDSDRCEAVKDILDKLSKDPSPTDLEQMASYILYGKDESGQTSIKRGETYAQSKRYNTFKTSDDAVLSLDEMIENPGTDEQEFRSAYSRDIYKKAISAINRPKYDRKTGEMIDPGDSDVPGMMELWERLDHLDRWVRMLQGKIPFEEGFLAFEDDYRLYRLRHNLVEMKRTQYYLKDAYKPSIHFQKLDHPKAQFYDWDGQSAYWIPYKEWEKRVSKSYTHIISKDLKDYETRGEGDNLEVKWVVYQHNFDWENYKHVYYLIIHYPRLKEYLREKLDTYGRTLIWDLERYIEMTPLNPIRRAIIDRVLQQMPRDQIGEELMQEFGRTYNSYYLSTLIANDIPKAIAKTATMNRLLIETPDEERKKCKQCKQLLPRHPYFFAKNSGRKDGLQSYCRECDRKRKAKKEVKENE